MKGSFSQRPLWSFVVLVPICCLVGASGAEISLAQTSLVEARCSENGSPCAVPVAQLGIAIPMGPVDIESLEKIEVVTNQPYQAQATTEIKQTLADGSHILHSTTAIVARDSEGRTVRSQKLRALGAWMSTGGREADPTYTTIFDPITKSHIDFSSTETVARVTSGDAARTTTARPTTRSKQAIKIAHPQPVLPTFAIGEVGVPPSQLASQAQGETTLHKTESLGSKNMEGVQTLGTRSSDTIPAGTIGNEKDIIVIHETWYSPELQLVIQSTQDDPRFGQTKYSLLDLRRGEPPRALFQIPAGYKIE